MLLDYCTLNKKKEFQVWIPFSASKYWKKIAFMQEKSIQMGYETYKIENEEIKSRLPEWVWAVFKKEWYSVILQNTPINIIASEEHLKKVEIPIYSRYK
jgi:hypothetical protein